MPSSRVSWQICRRLRAAPLDKEEPRIGALGSSVNKTILVFAAYTAKVISIDPLVTSKHIGTSQPIEAGRQHLYEKMTHT
jgi:hypothetical protein